MKDNLNSLNDFEEVMSKKLSNYNMEFPKHLDERVFEIFEKSLDITHSTFIIQEGYFPLMAASDDEESIAAELFDDEMKTKIKVFEAHDGISPYLVEIYPLEGYEDLFERHIGSTIIIKADGKEVLSSEIIDGEFSGFIPRDRVTRKKQSWSYQILSNKPDK